MGSDAFDRQVNRIWANHFGCTVEALQVPGTTLLPRDTMRGKGVVPAGSRGLPANHGQAGL